MSVNLEIIPALILVVHWAIVVGLSFHVIMRRPPVGVALAWLAVIFSVPFAGAVLYLLFGEKRLGRRRAGRIKEILPDIIHWQEAVRAGQAEMTSAPDSLDGPLADQAERVLGFPPLQRNDIELFSGFEAVFDRMIEDFDAAQTRIELGFYIWHEGGRTGDVVDALIRAAQRGVQCRALADALGSKAFLSGEQVRRLRQAGVELVSALPTGAVRTLFARTDLRNHRKIVVVDERIAWSGSQNLVDPRFFKQDSGVGEWVDAMVRVTGPAAAALAVVFRLDWSSETRSAFSAPSLPGDSYSAAEGAVIQVVPSGPGLRPEAIHQLLLSGIYSARRELVMTTPYFVPDDSIHTALQTAALRGVDVNLVVPAHNDSLLVRYASAACYGELMAAGVRIALFNGGLLHTKSMCVDRKFSVFGSVNLDMRSLWLNFEISLFVYDRGFTGRLRSLQDSYLEDSDWLDPDEWRQRPARRRLLENTCRLVGPLL